MSKVYIMSGIPGSGKSTYAKKLAARENCVIHSSDAIRAEISGDQQDLSNDKEMWRILNERVHTDLQAGRNVIIDTTGATAKRRATFLDNIKDIPCQKVAVVIKADLNTCLKQNKMRDAAGVLPDEVIKNFTKFYTVPSMGEGFNEIMFVRH